MAIADPKPLINRCIEAAVELREAFVDLTNNRDYRLAYDPYWVRVHPYRVRVTRGGTAEAAIVAKNFMDVPTVYEIKLACPKGITVDPSRVAAGEPTSRRMAYAVVSSSIERNLERLQQLIGLNSVLSEPPTAYSPSQGWIVLR